MPISIKGKLRMTQKERTKLINNIFFMPLMPCSKSLIGYCRFMVLHKGISVCLADKGNGQSCNKQDYAPKQFNFKRR